MFSEHKNNTASWENEHTQKNYIFWEEPTVTHRAPCHWVHFSKWHEKVCFYWKLQTILQNFFCKWSTYSPSEQLGREMGQNTLCLHCILIYFKEPFVRLGEVVLQDKFHPNNAVQETKRNTNTVLNVTHSGLHRASSSTWVTESFNP